MKCPHCGVEIETVLRSKESSEFPDGRGLEQILAETGAQSAVDAIGKLKVSVDTDVKPRETPWWKKDGEVT